MASGHASRINRPNTWLLRPTCDAKKVLANTEPSTHGTSLPSSGWRDFVRNWWITGPRRTRPRGPFVTRMYGPARGIVELVDGLASMYPASGWSSLLRATMDISARAISLTDRPRVGHQGHQYAATLKAAAMARTSAAHFRHSSGSLVRSGEERVTGTAPCSQKRAE